MFESISIRDLDYLVNDPNVIIVDLRSSHEYKKKHVKNAINIDYNDLYSNLDKLSFRKTIVLYCERGSISLIAAKKLDEYGYRVKTVIGGIHMYGAQI